MSCTSLQNLARSCGTAGIVGGLEKLYVIQYSDLSGSFGGEVYQVSGSVISDITPKSGSSYVEVGLLKSTAGINEELTKNQQNGSAYITQTVSVTLSDLSPENKTWVESLINSPVSFIVKTRTKKYFAAGLNGDMELATLTGGTGVAEGDLVGYQLTFTGISSELLRQVDPTLIPDIT